MSRVPRTSKVTPLDEESPAPPVVNLFDPQRELDADTEVTSVERASMASVAALLQLATHQRKPGSASPFPPSSPLHFNSPQDFPAQQPKRSLPAALSDENLNSRTLIRELLGARSQVTRSKSMAKEPLLPAKARPKSRTAIAQAHPQKQKSISRESLFDDDEGSEVATDEESESPPGSEIAKLVSDTATLPPSRCLRFAAGRGIMSQSPSPLTPADTDDEECDEIDTDAEESVSECGSPTVQSSKSRKSTQKRLTTRREAKSSSYLAINTGAAALPAATSGTTGPADQTAEQPDINNLSIGIDVTLHAAMNSSTSSHQFRLPTDAPIGEQMHFLERYAMLHGLNGSGDGPAEDANSPLRRNLQRTTSASLTRNLITLFVLLVIRMILFIIIQILRFFHIFVLGTVTWLAILVNPYFFWFSTGTIIFILSHILISIPINRFLKRNVFRSSLNHLNGVGANGWGRGGINFEEEAVDSLMDRLPGALLWLSHVMIQENLSTLRSVCFSVPKTPTFVREVIAKYRALFKKKADDADGEADAETGDVPETLAELDAQLRDRIGLLIDAIDSATRSLLYVKSPAGQDGVVLEYEAPVRTSDAEGDPISATSPSPPQYVTRPIASKTRFPLSLAKYGLSLVGHAVELGAGALLSFVGVGGRASLSIFSPQTVNISDNFGENSTTIFNTNTTDEEITTESIRRAIRHPITTWQLDSWHIAIAIETLINIVTNTMINFLNEWETIPKQRRKYGAIGIGVLYFGLVVCGWDLFWLTSSELSLMPPIRSGWETSDFNQQTVSMSTNFARAREVPNAHRSAAAFSATINDLNPALSVSPTMLFIFRTLALYRFFAVLSAIIRATYRSAFAESAVKWRLFRVLQRPVMLRAVALHWDRWRIGGELGGKKSSAVSESDPAAYVSHTPITIRSLSYAIFIRFPFAIVTNIILRPVAGAFLSMHWWRRLRCYRFIPSTILLSYVAYSAFAAGSVFDPWDVLLSQAMNAQLGDRHENNPPATNKDSSRFLSGVLGANRTFSPIAEAQQASNGTGNVRWEDLAEYQLQSFPVFAVCIYIIAVVLTIVDFLENSFAARPTSAVLLGDHREREVIVGDILRDGGPSAVMAAFALRCRSINELLRQLSAVIPSETALQHPVDEGSPSATNLNASSISSPVIVDFSSTSNVFVEPPTAQQLERASRLFTNTIHSLYSNNDPVLLLILRYVSPVSSLVDFYFAVRRMFFSSTSGHKILLITGEPIFSDEVLPNGKPDPRYQQPESAFVNSPIGPLEMPFPTTTAVPPMASMAASLEASVGGYALECTICCEEIVPMSLKRYIGRTPHAGTSVTYNAASNSLISGFLQPKLAAKTSDLAGIGVKLLPCGHTFHQRCILPWLESHRTCVLCRATVVFPPTCLNKALACVGIEDRVSNTVFSLKKREGDEPNEAEAEAEGRQTSATAHPNDYSNQQSAESIQRSTPPDEHADSRHAYPVLGNTNGSANQPPESVDFDIIDDIAPSDRQAYYESRHNSGNTTANTDDYTAASAASESQKGRHSRRVKKNSSKRDREEESSGAAAPDTSNRDRDTKRNRVQRAR